MSSDPVAPVIDRFAIGGGLSLRRLSFGGGSHVVVCVNGGPGYPCDYMTPFSVLASPDRRVVLYDQLGTGESDTASSPDQWSMAEYARHIEVLREDLGAPSIDVVGHSFGSTIALEYALRYPGRVRRLVISHSTASTPRFVASQIRQLRELLGAATCDMVLQAERDEQFEGLDYRIALARYFAWTEGAPCGEDTVDLPAWDRFVASAGPALVGMWGPGMITSTGAARDWDVESRLAEIQARTLILSSELDHCPPEVAAPMADRIPRAQWLLFQRRGHSVFGQDPVLNDIYLGAIAGFLGAPDPDEP